jgi:hypothetical protein
MSTLDPLDPHAGIPPEVRRNMWGWFGEPWWSYVCYDEAGRLIEEMRKPFPAGESCLHCLVPFDEAAGHSGQAMPATLADGTCVIRHAHKECLLRDVLGPLAHIERRCHCFGGDGNTMPGMTAWEEAQEVWRLHQARMLP